MTTVDYETALDEVAETLVANRAAARATYERTRTYNALLAWRDADRRYWTFMARHGKA